MYPASFAGKRFTSTEEVNTVLEQVWCNDVGDFRLVDWLEFAQHVLRSKYPKNEINKIRLNLASNRGRGALTELIQVQVWFCPGDKLTHKNTQTSTQAHACRVTDTDPNSLDTNTHGSPRPRIKHTLLHRHKFQSQKHTCKSRQNCYCCLAISVLTSKCSVKINKETCDVSPTAICHYEWLNSRTVAVVGWRIWDKLRPMREDGSILLYVHGNHKARQARTSSPRTAISLLCFELWQRKASRVQ